MPRIKCPDCPNGWAQPDDLHGWIPASFGPLVPVTCGRCGSSFNAYLRDLT